MSSPKHSTTSRANDKLAGLTNNKTTVAGQVFLFAALLLVVALLGTVDLDRYKGSSAPKTMGSMGSKSFGDPVVMGDESIMKKKAHGTTEKPPMQPLRWDVNYKSADKICCYNRHWAEHSGYFSEVPAYLKDLRSTTDKVEYFDSVTGKLLFTAPVGRTMEEFVKESRAHGWPSFRDAEVAWENVRVLPGGETVSFDGTHLGHVRFWIGIARRNVKEWIVSDYKVS